jgi:hypothetical protein
MWTDWQVAWGSTRFRVHFILAVLGIIAFAASLPYFFNEILLPKPGVQLDDPILNFFSPKDWSIEIFVLLYSITVISLLLNIKKPNTLLVMFQMYTVVNFMRMASLYLFTLEAPNGTIPLSDPFLTVFAYGKEVYVKDLFFSGHISTLCILFLVEERKIMKGLIFILTILVAVLLASQRVHYTLDMVAAPLISWLVFRFFMWFDESLKIFPLNIIKKNNNLLF